jgi:hypothetical protein
MNTNQRLIQWKEFNTTIKQRVNTLYSVSLRHADVMRFCAFLKSMEYFPSQNTIDDETIREQYDMWCQLSTQGQTEYLNLVAMRERSERVSRTDIDEDPTNVMN